MTYASQNFTPGSHTNMSIHDILNLQAMDSALLSFVGTNNVMTYGAKADGIADDGPAILAAVQAAWDSASDPAYGVPSVHVPAGRYRIATPVDFSSLNSVGDISGWSFICDAGTVFVDDTAAACPVNLEQPTNGGQFMACRFQFGRIIGNPAGTNTVQMKGVNDSFIDIQDILSSGGNGFTVTSSTTVGTFNNNIRIGRIYGSQANGFVTNGSVGVWGFQGNHVWIGQVTQSVHNGIVVDALGTGLNSVDNHFDISVVESNGEVGILDNNGKNWWEIANSNTNGTIGFDLTAGAAGTPVIRGVIDDGVILNSQKADLVNYGTATGNVSAPAVPASTVAQRNTFDRPAEVYVTGGTVTVIAIGGVATGVTSGVFRLVPGETITLTYSVVPTWKWFLV